MNNKNWLVKAGAVLGFIIAVITVATFIVSFIGRMYKRDFMQESHQQQIEQISKQLEILQKTIIVLKSGDADFQLKVNEQIGDIQNRVDKLPAINWWLQENVRAVRAVDRKVDSLKGIR